MIKPEKRQKIKVMISQGMPYQDIADQEEISLRSVKNIAKELKDDKEKAPSAGQSETEQELDTIDYNTILSVKEEKYVSKIRAQIALYEDDEEGWTFHLTAKQLKQQKSGIWWACIVYPVSAPEDWQDKLKTQCDMLGMQAAISPLHDKDVWSHDSPEADIDGRHYAKGERYKTGDPKKSHWHVLLKSMLKISYEEATEILRSLTNGTYPIKIKSLRASYEYLIHLNETDKYHYDKDEIQTIGGFCVEPNEYEKKVMLSEIDDLVISEQIVNYYDLVYRYQGYWEYEALIAVRSTHFYNLTKGLWQTKNADDKTRDYYKQEINDRNIKIQRLNDKIKQLEAQQEVQ